MMKAISGCKIFDGESEHEGRCLVLDEGRIWGIVDCASLPPECDTTEEHSGWLLPGFVDLQVNGGGGALFNESPTLECIRTMGEAHRSFGTTSFFPTLISDSLSKMKEAALAVREAMAQFVPGVAGIHYEGPFLGPGRPGVHDPSQFRSIDAESIELIRSLAPIPVLVTIAPESCDVNSVMSLVQCGATVSIGHTNASYEECLALLNAGASGFTHLFNAMSPMGSREPGAVGAALASDHAWFSIIADGHHVHPASLKVALRAKSPGRAILVTDAMPVVGSQLSEFFLSGDLVKVIDERCISANGALAGSTLDMMSAVNNAHQYGEIDWNEAIAMATQNPALAAGLPAGYGSLKRGAPANIALVNTSKKVTSTWINGSRLDH